MDRTQDELEIRSLSAAYADGIAQRDPALVCAVFSEDGVLAGPGIDDIVGHDALVVFYTALLTGMECIYQLLHSGQIWIEGDEATGRWYLSELEWPKGERPIHAVCMYQDRATRTANGWRLARREMSLLYLERTDLPGRRYPHPLATPSNDRQG